MDENEWKEYWEVGQADGFILARQISFDPIPFLFIPRLLVTPPEYVPSEYYPAYMEGVWCQMARANMMRVLTN
jgi:hypothetical protein